jgi:hypothetical protein
METFITAAFLAVLTGLAWLAYKHPAGYSRIDPWLTGGSLVLFALVGTWDTAFNEAHRLLIPYLDLTKQAQIERALDTERIPLLWLLLGWAACCAYLAVLRYLPQLTGSTDKDAGGPSQ